MPYIPNKQMKNVVIKKFKEAKKKANVSLRDKARNNAPVASGRLRQEIEVDKDGIISNAPYSAAVEFGTFKKAANPFMRKSVKDSKKSYFEKFKDII